MSARKLSITQEQTGQIRIQFISKRPSAAACRKRSIVSCLGKTLVGGKSDGIDAQELGVARRTDMAFELGDKPRTPRSRRFQRRQALLQKLFVNARHGESPLGNALIPVMRSIASVSS